MTLTFRVDTKEITQGKQKADELILYLQQLKGNVARKLQYKSDIIRYFREKAIHFHALGGASERQS